MRLPRSILALLLLTAAAPARAAETFPDRPIRLIVPFPPGGPNDIIARVIGQRMSELAGQPVVVDNRGGQGGVLGTDAVAKAKPDGYTIAISSAGALAISPTMEVLSSDNTDGRIHFAVPVSVELRRQPFRMYGSAGIFTRGSFFSGAAVEWSARSGMALTGALTQSYSLKDDAVLDSMGIGRQRMDVSLGIAYPLGTSAATFVSVGRSLTSMEEGGTSLALSGGISLRFSASPNP